MKLKIFSLFILISNFAFSQATLKINLLPGEKVWSGFVDDGAKMPFDAGYHFDFYSNNGYNQAQPLLLGNKGLWVWSEETIRFRGSERPDYHLESYGRNQIRTLRKQPC